MLSDMAAPAAMFVLKLLFWWDELQLTQTRLHRWRWIITQSINDELQVARELRIFLLQIEDRLH